MGDRLRWYPASWRARYGEDLRAHLEDEYGDAPLPATVRCSLAVGGLRERMRAGGLVGDTAPPFDRAKAGTLLVLCGWAAFVVAGASFAKFSEHFDQALPHRLSTHAVPDAAFATVQLVAAIAAALVVVGAAVALPALARFLRSGGWPTVRRHVGVAGACTFLTVLVTVPLVVWAHHLTSQQRNGGLPAYGTSFLAWAALVALTVALWTVAAVAIARHLELPRPVLATEAALAVGVAVAMAVMLATTALWWGAMANRAPTFFNGGTGDAASSPWDVWLAATVGLMLLATVVSGAGVARLARTWPRRA